MRLNEEWWEYFCEQTNNLSQPKVFENILSSEDITELNASIDQICQDLPELTTKGLRIWEGEVQLTEGQIKSRFKQNSEESLISCAEKYFTKNFGIILNKIQRLDSKIKEFFAKQVTGLVSNYGGPLGGFEVTLFVGNYEYTPLGFHKDPKGHKVIHFQLGPGVKEMYLIDKETYENELSEVTMGLNGCTEIDKILPHTEKFTIPPGALFFMPESIYHIGRNVGLGASLTLWHRDLTKSEMGGKLMQLLAKKMFAKDSNSVIPPDTTSAHSIDYLKDNLSEIISINEEVSGSGLEKLLDSLITEFKLTLHSNSFMDVDATSINEKEYEVKIEDAIIGIHPYKLVYDHLDTNLNIFIQGKKLHFPYSKHLPDLLERINKFEEIAVRELINNLAEDWEVETCLYFLSQLYTSNGFKRIEEKTTIQ